MLGEGLPALVSLAFDIGFASLALGIEAIERLVEPLVRAFSSVDSASDGLAAHDSSLSPKKRGPFHRLPAIAVAAAERLGNSRSSQRKPRSSTITSIFRPCHCRLKRAPTPRCR